MIRVWEFLLIFSLASCASNSTIVHSKLNANDLKNHSVEKIDREWILEIHLAMKDIVSMRIDLSCFELSYYVEEGMKIVRLSSIKTQFEGDSFSVMKYRKDCPSGFTYKFDSHANLIERLGLR